jgi:hypothetical protein
MRKIFTLSAGCLMAFGLIGPAPCVAQATEASATFVVRATATIRDGATGGPESWVLGKVKVGESRAFGIYVEGFSKIATAPWRGTEGSSNRIWRVDVRPQSIEIDTVRFALVWSRYEGAGSALRRVAGDTRVVTLRKGKRHLFDLARAVSPGAVFANVSAEVELTDVFDPQYPDLAIAYELSLVRELGNGKTTSRVVRLSGKQGEERSFSFEIPLTLDGVETAGDAAGEAAARQLAEMRWILKDLLARYSADHPDVRSLQAAIARLEREVGAEHPSVRGRPTVRLQVTGAVSSRLRADGTFDVRLHAERALDCGGGTVGGGTGSQEFRAANGESVGIEFPPVIGGCSRSEVQTVPPGARAGVTLRDGRLWIAFDEFFANQKTALLVKVLRQRDP